jgi:hypothetical protein
VISLKGKQVYKLSSSDTRALVTVETRMSAAGTDVPPIKTFPRKRMKPERLNGAPAETVSG